MMLIFNRNTRTGIFVSLLCCFCLSALAQQEPEPLAVKPNADFQIRTVNLPDRDKQLKYLDIIAQLPDGGVWVRASNQQKADGGQATRRFYAVKRSNNGTFEGKEIQFDYPGLLETSCMDNSTICCVVENQQGERQIEKRQLINGVPDADNKEQLGLPGNWDEKARYPYFFKTWFTDQTAVVFSAKAPKRGYDLYISMLNGTRWTEPVLINSDQVNSSGNETFPWVSEDGQTLCFTSDRPCNLPGAGGKNIWCARTNASFRLWEKARLNPLPEPINMSYDDRDLVVVQSDEYNGLLKTGLFISNRDKGRDSLYVIEYTKSRNLKPRPSNYYALLIAADSNPNFPQLSYTVRNTQVLANFLKDTLGFLEVETLIEPSNKQVLDHIARFQALGPDDNLLIAYMGHGILMNDGLARMACANGKDDGMDCLTTEDFEQALGKIERCRHILVVLDACFGGMFRRPVRGNYPVELNEPSRYLLTSSLSQVVPDGSCFFKYLMEKIRAYSMSGKILFADKLKEEINSRILADPGCNRFGAVPQLQPIGAGNKGGMFRFPVWKKRS